MKIDDILEILNAYKEGKIVTYTDPYKIGYNIIVSDEHEWDFINNIYWIVDNIDSYMINYSTGSVHREEVICSSKKDIKKEVIKILNMFEKESNESIRFSIVKAYRIEEVE